MLDMSDHVMFDVAVVGAGPAGIAAALSASAAGARVVVIDEQRRPGGQIFRQPPREFVGSKAKFSAGYPWAYDLLEQADAAPGITWKHESTAFGVFRDRAEDSLQGTADPSPEGIQLAISGPNGAERLPVRRLLIATGAYDLPVAIPGWTLPGVMMAGAVQGFIKSQRLLVSERLVLAGSHPLLLVVADQLRASGADIAEIAFARGLPSLREAFGALPAVPGHTRLFAETGVALTRLIAAGVRISTRTVATRAVGTDRVEGAELARIDENWKVKGSPRVVPASTLVLGYGFQASTELARQAGCTMLYNSAKGGWIVAHDQNMATSSPGIYVAGEPTGVAGAEQSRAEGHLAGLAIAQDLGFGRARSRARARASDRDHSLTTATDDLTSAVESARTDVHHAQKFSSVVQSMFAPNRKGLAALATPDTIVCRCELVTQDTVTNVLAHNPHLSSASGVKLECRSGMGPCQGRYCETTVASLVAIERGRSIADVGSFTAHVPVKPVPVSALTVLDGE
ncbi:NAD(P)/FAD-dependent oxidoreductase [Glaciibacter psychrotolerans]